MLKMALKQSVRVAFICWLISGCAANTIPIFTATPDYSSLYLRGVFTWWEADEKYKLIEISDDIFATKIRLIADGQPYDFRFADVHWSPDLNCGYVNANIDQIIELDKTVKANCKSKDENFQFTPLETGLYQFSIDFSGLIIPKVQVKFISN